MWQKAKTISLVLEGTASERTSTHELAEMKGQYKYSQKTEFERERGPSEQALISPSPTGLAIISFLTLEKQSAECSRSHGSLALDAEIC